MNPLVSVLIPAFNSQEWIADTIESALAQTWAHKEVIIVDDGSRDQTLAVAKRFASKRVLVLSQDNQGAAAARNKALSLSQGDYIQWLDADDILGAEKIARQMQVAIALSDKYKLLSSEWGGFLYRLHEANFVPTRLWCDHLPVDWLINKMQYNLHMQTATWLVSRELTDRAGLWDSNLSFDDDGEYFCRVLLQSNGVKFVPGSKVFYRQLGVGNLSTIGQSDKKLESLLRSIQLHIRYLHSLEESDRVRSASVQYLQTWLRCYYPEKPDIVEKLKEMAIGLGGQLSAPSLSWKYEWLCTVFGWETAKQVQQTLSAARWSIARTVSKLRFAVEQRFLRSDQ